MRFTVHQASKIGGRQIQSGSRGLRYTNEALLLVLADGMGGHLHGEVAAQIAVHSFMRAFGVSKGCT